jgi:hypothetical protein
LVQALRESRDAVVKMDKKARDRKVLIVRLREAFNGVAVLRMIEPCALMDRTQKVRGCCIADGVCE